MFSTRRTLRGQKFRRRTSEKRIDKRRRAVVLVDDIFVDLMDRPREHRYIKRIFLEISRDNRLLFPSLPRETTARGWGDRKPPQEASRSCRRSPPANFLCASSPFRSNGHARERKVCNELAATRPGGVPTCTPLTTTGT